MIVDDKKPTVILFDDLEIGDVFIFAEDSNFGGYWMRIRAVSDGNAVELGTGTIENFDALIEHVIKLKGRFVVEGSV